MSRKMLIASMQCGWHSQLGDIPLNSMSVEWLFNNAGILLWAEKLLMTENDFANIHRQSYFGNERGQECARKLFDVLKSEGVVESFNQDEYLSRITLESIVQQSHHDANRWRIESNHEDSGEERGHANIKIGDNFYCQPRIMGVYGSLTLSRFLDCSCVLGSMERSFINDRFATLSDMPELFEQSSAYEVFNEIYHVFLPSLVPTQDYHLFCQRQASSGCDNSSNCPVNSTSELQKMIDFILLARENPDVVALAKKLDCLEYEVGQSPDRIMDALIRDIRKHERRLRTSFPAISNFTKVTQATSYPVALFGGTSADALIAVSAGSAAAIAASVNISIESIKAKHSWMSVLANSVTQGLSPSTSSPSAHKR